MEKISRILPSSSRVTSTDLSASTPVRPGTPTFGRAVGVSTNGPEAKEKEARELASIQAITDNFFMANKKDGVSLKDSPKDGSIAEEQLDQPEVGRYLDVNV